MNQERIKDRILRKASKLWGYSELESESSFDPVVSLLLSACAAELEKLGSELENSRSRIIERVLEVMFPEQVSGVVPARTLLQVNPLENNTFISYYSSFKTTIRKQNIYNPSESTVKDLYFSPSIETKLFAAKVKYLAYDNVMMHIEDFFSDEIIGKAEEHISSGELWLGIHSHLREDLEDLVLFIDSSNSFQKEIFYYYLKQVKVFFGNREYHLNEGYNIENDSLNPEQIITKNYSDVEYIYNEINRFYKPYFFTLKARLSFSEKPEKEELFFKHFPENGIADEQAIFWLKFKFSEAIVPEILQNVRFALNCVPFINIRNQNIGRRIKGRLNIIPIDDAEQFLELDDVSDEYGKRLDIKNYESENEEPIAVLRRGGVSRFDRRSASELLQYLLELIKDETAAFASIGSNSVNDILRQINQNMASLHQLAKEKNFVQANSPYLIISSGDPETDVQCKISYWSTAAQDGNDVKQMTRLTAVGPENGLFENSALAIRTSVGGKKKLSPQEKILEYRNALLTRGRIVTVADIRAFAMNHFRQLIKDVEVRKGTQKEVSLKGGFSRTIDVFLVRNKENIRKEEWEYLCDSFLLNLKNASANIYPYRLFEK